MTDNFSWQELYEVELFELEQEGFLLEDLRTMDISGKQARVPREADAASTGSAEAAYRSAYAALTSRQAMKIRQGYPYVEPDGLEAILQDAIEPPCLGQLSEEAYRDGVKGAWFGRCAGLVLGKPLEMGMDRRAIQAYLESVDAWPLRDWVPERSDKLDVTLRTDCLPSTRGHVAYVQSDDDLHYTILSLLLAEEKGEAFTLWDAGRNLLENLPYRWVWSSDRQLYRNLVLVDPAEDAEKQCEAFSTRMNPWREGMCPQLKSDFWGYVMPGEPRRGARLIHRLGRLSATKNGLYGGMFLQGCVSGALSPRPDVETILRCGLSNIPRRSRLFEAIGNVMRWHCASSAWEEVCDRIYGEYGSWYFAGSINNLCFIVLALLEGGLDYEKTIATAVQCGTDTDCNAANAGSIVGAAVGYGKLPRRWIDPLHDSVRSCVAGFGWGSLSELAERTVRVRGRMRAESASCDAAQSGQDS